jgi:hypothetical protein
MNTATLEIPTAAGEQFAGGIFAGRYFIGAAPYALIVSLKDEGEIARVAWGAKKKVAAATSYADGLANTDAMAAAGSKLAATIRALRIGGFDDWYLPSRLESMLLFGELQCEFQRDWYWTSTQYAGNDEYAWFQHFYDGHQYGSHKGDECRARAVRRVPI